jgi:hypothetical protein
MLGDPDKAGWHEDSADADGENAEAQQKRYWSHYISIT